jgi:hypothetical protein
MPELFTGLRVSKEEQAQIVKEYEINFVPFYKLNKTRPAGSLCKLFGSVTGDQDKVDQIMTPFYSVYSKRSLGFPPRRLRR